MIFQHSCGCYPRTTTNGTKTFQSNGIFSLLHRILNSTRILLAEAKDQGGKKVATNSYCHDFHICSSQHKKWLLSNTLPDASNRTLIPFSYLRLMHEQWQYLAVFICILLHLKDHTFLSQSFSQSNTGKTRMRRGDLFPRGSHIQSPVGLEHQT